MIIPYVAIPCLFQQNDEHERHPEKKRRRRRKFDSNLKFRHLYQEEASKFMKISFIRNT